MAIPALIAYFFFKNKYGKIAASVSQVLGRILRDVTDRHEKSLRSFGVSLIKNEMGITR